MVAGKTRIDEATNRYVIFRCLNQRLPFYSPRKSVTNLINIPFVYGTKPQIVFRIQLALPILLNLLFKDLNFLTEAYKHYTSRRYNRAKQSAFSEAEMLTSPALLDLLDDPL